MICLGDKYTCGGREFWCVGLEGDKKSTLQSGNIQITLPNSTIEENFQFVNALAVGKRFIVRRPAKGLEPRTFYTVEGIEGETIILNGGHRLSLEEFTAAF